MKTYSLNKYDFKKYLLAELPDTRQEDLIFWKKTIPMPVDLVYDIFEKRAELFSLYLHHIGAACLFSYALEKEGRNWQVELARQPTKENSKQYSELISLFIKHLAGSNVLPMLNELAGALMLTSFIANEQLLVQALCHEGRKYKRIYIPAKFKALITPYFPDILNYISNSNQDMFSNVVADELKIYRMGFADAFAGMFNKMIDFITDNTSSPTVTYASASDIKLIHLNKDPAPYVNIRHDKVTDGSLWGIFYKDSKNNYVLNSSHPFFDLVKTNGINSEQTFVAIIEGLATIEGETFLDGDLKIIENLRQELSRKLRLKAEENQNC
jgi:hypothetical protein